ncbi:MAG: LPS assembly protein LptD, partial [Bdellovibrionales bacterium]|nr:LPS assembly protein LptD [Bdellovibrionales bacterium]
MLARTARHFASFLDHVSSCRNLVLAIFVLATLLSGALAPNPAFGAATTKVLTKSGSPILISATTMFGDSEKQTIELVGDVQITFEGQTLRCDRALLNKETGQLIAEGNLILASPTTYVEGTRAELSYEDNTGLIFEGFVKSGQVLFEGKVLRKTGKDTYEAERATYTACTTCPPAWSFSGSRIDAEMGAYAHIRSAWFYLGGIRFFWFPYLVVPLKSERQTGFLFPLYEIDGDSFAIGLPFFWAISRSQDATLTTKHYSRRGWKALLNYRYLLSEESSGELNAGGFIQDRHFSVDSQPPSQSGNERSGRWFIQHDQLYNLPGGFINRAKLALVSDLRYPRDFPEEILGAGEPALENRLSLTKNSESLHSSIEAAYYVNLLKHDPLENNSDSVHRFPELRHSGTDRSILGSRFFLKWDFNYINFAREDFSYDDVVANTGGPPKEIDRSRGDINHAGSGVFNPETDVIRAGQRLDLRPELSAPFRIGPYLDVLPSIQMRYTQYSFNVTTPAGNAFDPMPTRHYIRGRLAIRTQLSRVYDLGSEDETGDETGAIEETDRFPASEAGVFQALQPPPPPKRPLL